MKDRITKLEKRCLVTRLNVIPLKKYSLAETRHFKRFYCDLAEGLYPDHAWCLIPRKTRFKIWRKSLKGPTPDFMQNIENLLVEALNQKLNQIAEKEALSIRDK